MECLPRGSCFLCFGLTFWDAFYPFNAASLDIIQLHSFKFFGIQSALISFL